MCFFFFWFVVDRVRYRLLLEYPLHPTRKIPNEQLKNDSNVRQTHGSTTGKKTDVETI
jgi:hypothetical protein